MGSTARPWHVFYRTFGLAVADDFNMDMGPGSPASAAHKRNHLPFLDHFTQFDLDGPGVGIACYQAIPMIDFNQIAVAVTLSGPGHNTTGNGNDVAALLAGQINTTMPAAFTGKRIGTVTIPGRKPAPGDGTPLHIALIFQFFSGRDLIEQAELFFPVVELLLKLENHLSQFRGAIGIATQPRLLRPAHRR